MIGAVSAATTGETPSVGGGARPVRLTRVPRGVRSYWVGLGRPSPEQVATDDYTCPEVTHRYANKSALVAALADGTAWLLPAEAQ